jgi:hypothetical protein
MRRFSTFGILALAGLVGCQGSEEDSFTLVKVTGTITKNGKPLADAKVSFLPEAGNAMSTPGADQTGPQGNYMLTFKGRTGVAAGKYKVIIEPPVEVPAGHKVPDELAKDPVMVQMELQARNAGKKQGPAAKKEVVKSEFPAEVEAKAASIILDFDVKS